MALCGASLLLGGGCLDDASRGNPLDPRSDNFNDVGQVTGRVTRFYPPFTAVTGVEVRLQPGAFLALTETDGQFAFGDVPTGTYRVLAEKEGFATSTDTVTVTLGETVETELRLDGLPVITEHALRTVHVSRWWPQNDLYLLEVVAQVEDADGLGDVEQVWVEMPGLSHTDTLLATQVPGQFVQNLTEEELPTSSLHALLGHTLRLTVQDRAGFVSSTPSQQLVRVVDETPVATKPQGLEVATDPRPVLSWEAVRLPYPFTYRVEVVRVETNIQTSVQVMTDIGPGATSVQVEEPLAAGSYFWTVSVVDEFGNRSRSKEAGFRVE